MNEMEIKTMNKEQALEKIKNIIGNNIFITFNKIGVSYVGTKFPKNINDFSYCYILNKNNAILMVENFFNKLKVNKDIKKIIKNKIY